MNGPQIIAHGDFDGIVSAALAGLWSGLNMFFFTGPESVRRIEMGKRDIVCDLPHPMREIRAWFDHHLSNIEEAQGTGWTVGEGAAREAASAARVVYEHIRHTTTLPPFIEETVAATDIVDTMGYATIEDWLAETPANVINTTIFLPGEEMKQASRYLHRLTGMIQRHGLADIVTMDEVRMRAAKAKEHARQATDTIRRIGKLLGGRICVLDFSEMKVAPRFSRNLAYTVFPEAEAVLTVNGVLQEGRRTNDLRLSLSLNPFRPETRGHDCAAILDGLGLGGGHPGAAGGKISAGSKDERVRLRDKMLADVLAQWTKQGAGEK